MMYFKSFISPFAFNPIALGFNNMMNNYLYSWLPTAKFTLTLLKRTTEQEANNNNNNNNNINNNNRPTNFHSVNGILNIQTSQMHFSVA